MPRRHVEPLVAMALLIPVAGCSDSPGPSVSPDTYVLQRVAGDPLPAVLSNNEFYSLRVISDTVRLQPDGTGTISGVRELVPVKDIPGDPPRNATVDITYQLVGRHLEISFVCPDLANCVPPPHLIGSATTEGGLQMRWGPQMIGREPLVYSRLRGSP